MSNTVHHRFAFPHQFTVREPLASGDPQNRFDKQPIIPCSGTGIAGFARQLWRNAFPLIVSKDRANQG
jgi:hypothetical protein